MRPVGSRRAPTLVAVFVAVLVLASSGAIAAVSSAYLASALPRHAEGGAQGAGYRSSENGSSNMSGPEVLSIGVGDEPLIPVYDPSNGFVYVTDYGSNNVSVINGSSVLANLTVGAGPRGEAYDAGDNEVYVANNGSGNVSVVSGLSVAATVPVGVNPYDVLYDGETGSVYVANYGSGNVSIINGTAVVKSVDVGTDPAFLVLDPLDGWVYVMNYGSGTVSAINGTSFEGTVQVGTNPLAAVYDGADGGLYVTNYGSANVSVLQGLNVTATVGVGLSPSYPVYDSANGTVYVPNRFSDDVSVIDGSTVEYTVNVGTGPSAGIYAGSHGNVGILNYESDNVSVISGRTASMSVNLGTHPYDVVEDAGTGNFYVTNSGSANVSLIVANQSGNSSTGEYQVTFTESGLPPGTGWAVSLGAFNATVSAPSIFFVVPSGTYPFDIARVSANGTLYVPQPRTGNLTVSTSNVTVFISFRPAGSYQLSFTETGLPSGTFWSVGLSPVGNASISNGSLNATVGFEVANGTYQFAISNGSANGTFYLPAPAMGNVTVHGASVTVPVSFVAAVNYGISFHETGLPRGTLWEVGLYGVPNGSAFNASSNGTIGFAEPNGTYSFAVPYNTSVNGTVYVPSPEYGVVTVNGTNVTENVTFARVATYALTFNETGLPPNSSWTVIVGTNGGYLANTSNGTTIGFVERNGSYDFEVVYTESLAFAPVPSSGVVTINGTNETVNITFERVAVYNLTFSETGLPSGASWEAFLCVGESGCFINYSTSSAIVFDVPNSTDFWSVGNVTVGPFVYAPVQYSGDVTIDGANVTIFVTYSQLRSLTFVESGLPNGTFWSVLLSGSEIGFESGFSTTSTNGFMVPNGSYSYYVDEVPGYRASPSNGSVDVAGANVTVNLRFIEVAYFVTFVETGLPGGAPWSATFNGSSESTVGSSLQFTAPNGTYAYVVTGPSGYEVVGGAAAGSILVTGKNVTKVEVFAHGATFALTFHEVGLAKGSFWCVSVGAMLCGTTSTLKVANLSAATYGYSVGSVGSLTTFVRLEGDSVGPTGSVTVTSNETFQVRYAYAVTFTEAGLAPGTPWSVSLVQLYSGGGVVTESSTGSSIVFYVTNGTYAFEVGSPSGYAPTASGGLITVRGGSVTVAVEFGSSSG